MYNKLFTKILDSSIWLAPDPVRLVWITLLAAMDEDGNCMFACAANVAARARVTVKQAELALAEFEAPDRNSGDPENEGRRIERFPGGWHLLNAHKYRAMVTKAIIREQTRQRTARYRKRDAGVTHGDANERKRDVVVTPSEALSEALSKAESKKEKPPTSSAESLTFKTFWNAYPNRKAKKDALKAWGKVAESEVESILKALSEQSQCEDWCKEDGRYVPHAATWLNGRRWEDEKPAKANVMAGVI